MNREQTIEAIKVMQAWVDGEVIQGLGTLEGETEWADLDACGATWTADRGPPGWNWLTVTYRVKPEPHVFYYVRAIDGEFGSFRWKDRKEAAEFIANNPELRWKSVVKFVEVVEPEEPKNG
jgi:hypothetical protein